MKKILLAICLVLLIIPVYAEHISSDGRGGFYTDEGHVSSDGRGGYYLPSEDIWPPSGK